MRLGRIVAIMAFVLALLAPLGPNPLRLLNDTSRRLFGGDTPQERETLTLVTCLMPLVNASPDGARVAITLEESSARRELHMLLGANGRIPSNFSTADWVISTESVVAVTGVTVAQVVKCNGQQLVAGARV